MISLDAIAAGADLSSLSSHEIASLLCLLSAAHSRIAAQIASTASAKGDSLLNADAAAQKLGVSRQWLYRRTDRLPFVVRLDGQVRYSSVGIDRFLAAKRGAK
jgi:predicted DNA-binding transcriptional regulator AlpA